MKTMRYIGLLMALVVAGCGEDPVTAPSQGPAATVFQATGNIAAKVDEFRNALGPSNGGTAGQQPGGRREIAWDAAATVPFDNRNDFPAAFFNSNVKAGATYTTAGTGFRNDSTLFREINPTYSTEFATFSAPKLFSSIGSNRLDQLFQVAGQPTPAVVRGFGVVFSDVDMAEKTSIQLFASDGTSLGTFTSPVRSDAAGLTFVGVTFADPIIARVRITMGTGALGAGVNDISAGGNVDLVVMDNVIYGEPKSAF